MNMSLRLNGIIQITREKSPSDEGIKIPYLFNVDEYFLEFEDSFSKEKYLESPPQSGPWHRQGFH